jgi:hypothetical protein
MPALVITVECDDPTDLDWLRHRCVAAVEDQVDTAEEEKRLDGKVDVSWDIEDDEGNS